MFVSPYATGNTDFALATQALGRYASIRVDILCVSWWLAALLINTTAIFGTQRPTQ